MNLEFTCFTLVFGCVCLALPVLFQGNKSYWQHDFICFSNLIFYTIIYMTYAFCTLMYSNKCYLICIFTTVMDIGVPLIMWAVINFEQWLLIWCWNAAPDSLVNLIIFFFFFLFWVCRSWATLFSLYAGTGRKRRVAKIMDNTQLFILLH